MKEKLHGAATAAALALAGIANFNTPAPEVKTVVMRPAPGQPDRVDPRGWGVLTKAEIDSLQQKLKGLKKRPVTIFCKSPACYDLALDFDNALSSQAWPSAVETPVLDTNVGLSIGPRGPEAEALAQAISTVTGNRLKPGMIDAKVKDRLVIVIGRKPQN